MGAQGYLAWAGIHPSTQGGAAVLATEDRKRLDDLAERVGKLEQGQMHAAQSQKIRDEAQAEVLTLREQQRQKDEAAAAERLTKIEDKLDKITESLGQRRR
jgi:wobble nucleotide-excising tRNase